MPKTKPIDSLIRDLESGELREVIIELCKLSNRNRQFIELYLQGSDAANPELIVKEARKKIHSYFYGRGTLPKLNLRDARNTVREYSKVLKEYPRSAADLKLYYVEVGTKLTEEYGDMYEGLYNSLVSMFASFCRDVEKHPEWYGDFEDRIRDLQARTYYVGWGYGDDIDALASELQERAGKGSSSSMHGKNA